MYKNISLSSIVKRSSTNKFLKSNIRLTCSNPINFLSIYVMYHSSMRKFPTNDIAGNPTDTQVRVRALAFAKYAKTTKRSVKETRKVQVSGKSVNKTYTYKNAVYVVSCTPTLGGVHANLHDTNIYNLELKKLAKTYGYTYVQLRDAKKNEFMNDGNHFKGGMTGYNKYMIQTFLKLKY